MEKDQKKLRIISWYVSDYNALSTNYVYSLGPINKEQAFKILLKNDLSIVFIDKFKKEAKEQGYELTYENYIDNFDTKGEELFIDNEPGKLKVKDNN